MLCNRWCTPDFRSALERAIQLGGDADINGVVAGAKLGARFGASGIPSRWLEDLEGGEDLLALIRALLRPAFSKPEKDTLAPSFFPHGG